MKQLSLLLLTVLLLSSCNLINPDEDEPTYLTINSMNLQASNAEGGNTENIIDAWVYVNSQLVGVYEMPATFPVLDQGEQVIEVFGGIRRNGVSELPEQYPFFERDSIIIDLDQGGKLEVSPTATYRDDAIFLLVEQFSAQTNILDHDADNNAATRIEMITGPESLDGSSGLIKVDTANSSFDIGSISLEELPTTANPFYVEMDFKSDLLLRVGLVGYDVFGNVIYSDFNQGFVPTDEWKKIYIDLTTAMGGLRSQPALAYYRLHLIGFLDPDNPEGITEAEILIDNLKLLKFE